MDAGATGGLAGAIRSVLHTDPKNLFTDWQEALKSSARPILHATTPPSEAGHVLVPRKAARHQCEPGPSAPGGKYFTYFAEGKFAIQFPARLLGFTRASS